MLQESDRADYGKEDVAAYPRLLAVDNEFVVPVGKTVRLLVTAADVLHAFAMPAFGVKMDAVPGRLNETWFKAEAEGCITASVPSFAARTTPTCRSRSASYPRNSSMLGWPLLLTMSRPPTATLMAAIEYRRQVGRCCRNEQN
jgi:hypothetical protein